MQINGGKLAGLQEVILSANEDLGASSNEFVRYGDDPNEGPPRPRIGDTLSIHLSQDARSQAAWTITVFVQVSQGWYVLGQPFVTVPPQPSGSPVGGDPPARTVGFASCPGAIGWRVLCSCPDQDEIAEIFLQSRQGGGGSSSFGVTPNVFAPPG